MFRLVPEARGPLLPPFPAASRRGGPQLSPAVRLHLKKLILWAAPLAGLACGGDGPTDLVLPSLRITTATTGVELDSDGYVTSIDGQSPQPVGVQATLTIDRLPDGEHSVELSGLAPNCEVSGENPRAASVQVGATASVAFAVVCRPTTGILEVVTATSGQPADADGFVIMLDGAASDPIGPTATVSFPAIGTGRHTVELSGVAPNCQVTGDHPLGVVVDPGQTARVSFAINCVPTAGGLTVTVSGLPNGTAAAVTVSGPNNFSASLTGTGSLTGLVPGSYAVAATNVVVAGTTYTPSIGRPTLDVVAGGMAAVTVSYTAVGNNVTLNLRVDGLYITQSTQTYGSSVPLVAGRDAYLRVFVVANESNTARPAVRVRLSRPGAAVQTFTISAPTGPTPTQVQEGTLASSWNTAIPASAIQPGLSVFAEVDPGNTIEESNDGDNRFPASGSKALAVRSVPTAAIRFVRVLQAANNLEGVVGNTDELMNLARRMHPLNNVQTNVRSTVFTINGPLLPNDAASWTQALSDFEGARTADPDGTSWTYFGVVKVNYGRQDGIVGQGFQEFPVAIGYDDPADASRVVAHELGHTWGRRHSPCGGPDPRTLDELYPGSGSYSGGRIGVFGFDVAAGSLKARSVPDIMGYCADPPPWISDYTYRAVMDFRQANPGSVVASAVPQPSLLIWGRIVNGQPVLEPAFEIVTRPNLPTRPGPYTVSAAGVDGSRLFTLSFDVAAVDDNPAGNGHFAFAVPLNQAGASRLGSLRLDGPTGIAGSSRRAALISTESASQSIVARQEGENVSLRWNAAAHPMIMVRDPDTGEVLSFARGGSALVRTAKAQLDLDVSDGVRSQRVRVAINRS